MVAKCNCIACSWYTTLKNVSSTFAEQETLRIKLQDIELLLEDESYVNEESPLEVILLREKIYDILEESKDDK